MHIKTIEISKTFDKKHIFSNITLELKKDTIYGISGRNGSGKSTFLKILAGYITPNSGEIIYSVKGNIIPSSEIYRNVSFAAPYLDLYEGATLLETLIFHFELKKIIPESSIENIISMLGYDKNTIIQSFSSGMLQRLKLCLAIFSDTELLLIDEPTETLDVQGQEWFLNLIKNYSKNRIIVISSNKEKDFVHCQQIISIENFKL